MKSLETSLIFHTQKPAGPLMFWSTQAKLCWLATL